MLIWLVQDIYIYTYMCIYCSHANVIVYYICDIYIYTRLICLNVMHIHVVIQGLTLASKGQELCASDDLVSQVMPSCTTHERCDIPRRTRGKDRSRRACAMPLWWGLHAIGWLLLILAVPLWLVVIIAYYCQPPIYHLFTINSHHQHGWDNSQVANCLFDHNHVWWILGSQT